MSGATVPRAHLLRSFWLAAALSLPQAALALCSGVCSCSVTTTGVAFGPYDPLSASAVTANGNVAVSCGGTLGLLVSYDIALSGGSVSGFSPRKMAAGGNQLAYNLHTNGAYTGIWGDGTGGTQTVSGSMTILVLSGTTANYPVYGRIPGAQTTVPPGSYGDSVQVTVTFQ